MSYKELVETGQLKEEKISFDEIIKLIEKARQKIKSACAKNNRAYEKNKGIWRIFSKQTIVICI